MKDRVSTKILNNGATRYGVYDETGALLRYEYIKLEDEPSTEGDFFNKANMIPDSITAMLGLKMSNPQVADALNVLANVGNLHVWERVQSGVTDYLTSTDPNAYPKQSAAGGQDAYYTLGDVVTGSFMIGSTASGYITTWRYGTSVSISDDGTLSLSGTTGTVDGTSSLVSDYSVLNGKFVYVNSNYSNIALNDGKIYFIPSDANIKTDGSMFANMMLDKYQSVTGHAAIPSNTTITYLGQLGGGARIEVGSYVGTGTYGSDNPCSITLSKDSAIVFILQNGVFKGVLSKCASDAGGYSLVSTSAGSGYSYYSFLALNVSASGNTISWYHKSDTEQLNAIGKNYTWVALIID